MENWRWENFTPQEVLSPDGLKMLRRNNLKLQGFALDRLQWYREFIKAPISVNHAGLKYRGYRSASENKRIGGVVDSSHCQGVAFDMNCYSTSLATFAVTTVAYTLEQIRQAHKHPYHRGFRGVGIYPRKKFIHGDFRSFPALSEDYIVMWNGDAGGVLILHEKDAPKTLPALLHLLKTELHLPTTWSL